MPLSIRLDAQVRATILAALAHYAQTGQGEPGNRNELIHTLATKNDAQMSMDDAGIAYAFRLMAEAQDIEPHFGARPVPDEPEWRRSPRPDWGSVLREAEQTAGEALAAD